MTDKELIIQQASEKDKSAAIRLLAYAVSPDRAEEAFERYIQSGLHHLFKAEGAGGLIGIIGVRPENNSAVIMHIAVSEEARGQGVGSRLVGYVEEKFGQRELCAETDWEAVEFYRKAGFAIRSLGEKYPGTERFWCVRIRKRG